jgi:hypothetical protein
MEQLGNTALREQKTLPVNLQVFLIGRGQAMSQMMGVFAESYMMIREQECGPCWRQGREQVRGRPTKLEGRIVSLWLHLGAQACTKSRRSSASAPIPFNNLPPLVYDHYRAASSRGIAFLSSPCCVDHLKFFVSRNVVALVGDHADKAAARGLLRLVH